MIWVIAVMLVILLIEVPILFRSKAYRELLYFGFLWLLAFVYASFTALKAPLPTVVDVLQYIYSQVNYFPPG
ncbi:MAG: hypothetical protein GX996_03395 [Firmicutes bacterium]|nr:hypothetical protein [Bacillota bacterium]